MMICMGGCVSAVRMSGQTEWRHSPLGLNERMFAYTPPFDRHLQNEWHICLESRRRSLHDDMHGAH